jgi:hypothetical protein
VEEGNLVYTREKISVLDSVGKDPTQSRHGALSNLQKKLPELACLGRRRLIVIQNELLIWNYKGTAEDHFRASLVKFGGC